jgi:hypothetical protein
MLFGQALQNLLAHLKLAKPPLAVVMKDAIILILILFVLKANIPILSKCLYVTPTFCKNKIFVQIGVHIQL